VEQSDHRVRQRAKADVGTPAARKVDADAPVRSAGPEPTRLERNDSRSRRRASSTRNGAPRWTSYTEPRLVSEALCRLMVDATPGDVQELAKKQGLEASQLVDDVIYASAPAPSSHPLISAKWLIELHFAGGRLRDILVRRGLSGP
jgi:hypothetical protein